MKPVALIAAAILQRRAHQLRVAEYKQRTQARDEAATTNEGVA